MGELTELLPSQFLFVFLCVGVIGVELVYLVDVPPIPDGTSWSFWLNGKGGSQMYFSNKSDKHSILFRFGLFVVQLKMMLPCLDIKQQYLKFVGISSLFAKHKEVPQQVV